MKTFVIMLQNRPVIKTSPYEYEIYAEHLTPWVIKKSVYKRESNKIYYSIIDWITTRIIHYNHNNGNWLWNYMSLPRSLYCEDVEKFAVKYHLTSVYDEYWIKTPDDPVQWEEINPKINIINKKTTEIQLGFAGGRYTYQKEDGIIMPAYTTYGNMQKAWMNNKNNIFLYKRNDKGCKNAKNEVLISRILDHTNCPHVIYENSVVVYQKGYKQQKEYACRCRSVCEEGYSLIHAEDVYLYCKHNNIDFHDFIMSIAKEDILKMCIIDYLFGNPDRHLRNWGFIQDDITGKLQGLAPLFDHDRCFSDISDIHSQVFPETTMKNIAMKAIKETDFQITGRIYPWMFPSYPAYRTYLTRYREIFQN